MNLPPAFELIKKLRNLLKNKTLCSLALLMPGIFSLIEAKSSINQTSDFSPIEMDFDLPYRIKIEKADFSLPAGVHSFAWAEYDGKWLILAGRTNGMHGFNSPPYTRATENFPSTKQNHMVFVVDPKTKTTAYRSLADYRGTKLKPEQVETLLVTSPQSYQAGSKLYMTGGYGVNYRTGKFETKDTLTSIDIPGLMKWVTADPQSQETAAKHIQQIHDPAFKVTGGSMAKIGNHPTLLIFGQNFAGQYDPATSNGSYTEQVRIFKIENSGNSLSASIKDPKPENPDPNFRRRDLNVLPIVHYNEKGVLKQSLVALSGVFTEEGGIWTVPVEINAEGQAFMANPNRTSSFKQGMNNYTSATVGLFSEKTGEMQNILMGGISYKFYEDGHFKADPLLPFINQITSVNIDAEGNYQQFLMNQEYPLIPVTSGPNKGQNLRFGAGAQLFLPEDLPTFANGVIKLDQLQGDSNLIGYIVGGIQSEVPNTQTMLDSSASNYIFRVMYLRVPTLDKGQVKEVFSDDLGTPAGAYVVDGATLKTMAAVNSDTTLTLRKKGLTFDTGEFNSTLRGIIRGSGAFRKIGKGTLTLSGNSSSYNGLAEVQEGILKVDSSAILGGTLRVKSEGILLGNGTVNELLNFSVVVPTLGALTVQKDYLQGKRGALIVEIKDNAHTMLQVKGHAQLNGALLPQFVEIPQAGKSYQVLSATSLSGVFSEIATTITPTLFFEPHYLSNGVVLEITRNYLSNNLAELTDNEQAIGGLLNRLAVNPSTESDAFLREIDILTTNTQVERAYDELMPSTASVQTTIAFVDATLQTDNMIRRMHQLREAPCKVNLKRFYPLTLSACDAKIPEDCQEQGDKWGTFLTGRGVFGNQKKTSHEIGYDFTTSGISFGADYALLKEAYVGIMGGYNSAEANLNQSSGKVRLSEYLAGVYATGDYCQFFYDALFNYSWNEYRNKRHIRFSDIKRKAHSHHKGHQYTLYGDVGYTYHYRRWILEPMLSLQAVAVNIDKYREHGADSLNLSVKEQKAHSFQGALGGTVKYLWSTRATKAMVNVNASFVHEFANSSRSIKAQLANNSDSKFSIQTSSPERNFAVVGAGVSVMMFENVMLYLNYDAEVGQEHFAAQGINGGVRMEF